jgi:lipocalin
MNFALLSKPRRAYAALCGALLLSAGASAATPAAVQPVPNVDLDRYAGRWYELARTPNLFELNCTCVTATYAVTSPTSISVHNACNKGRASGRLDTIDGSAVAPDPAAPAKLKVRFDGMPFAANYWIVDLVDDPQNPSGPYDYATVSGPGGGFLFLLSRKPKLETAADRQALRGVLQRLHDQQLPVWRLNPTPQPAACNYDAQQP